MLGSRPCLIFQSVWYSSLFDIPVYLIFQPLDFACKGTKQSSSISWKIRALHATRNSEWSTECSEHRDDDLQNRFPSFLFHFFFSFLFFLSFFPFFLVNNPVSVSGVTLHAVPRYPARQRAPSMSFVDDAKIQHFGAKCNSCPGSWIGLSQQLNRLVPAVESACPRQLWCEAWNPLR